jgi:hypothetical protein
MSYLNMTREEAERRARKLYDAFGSTETDNEAGDIKLIADALMQAGSEDTALLDWIEQYCYIGRLQDPDTPNGLVWSPTVGPGSRPLRKAIRAAMQAENDPR